MDTYFISGTSKGIGYYLAITLLQNENNTVIGFSRTNTIVHKNFTHIQLDLSDIESVNNFEFVLPNNTDKIFLINNAGIIGDIKKVGNVDSISISNVFDINITAPSILMNKFIGKFQNRINEKIILNISSGAGRHSISSWAAYCASKSALDMFSQVVFDEQQSIDKNKAVKIYSVAPGIVDTPMQGVIRSADSADFEKVNQFIDYKNNNMLSSPEDVSKKIIEFLNNSHKYKNVIYDIRNI